MNTQPLRVPEAFLHYVWRTLRFDFSHLQTTEGLRVGIRKPGIWNHDQGPDFLHAWLDIGKTEWHGHVELHLHTDDWYAHQHDRDTGYNNTVLHVVLDSSGRPVLREDGSRIPELALRPYLPSGLMEEYQHLCSATAPIPCSGQLQEVSSFHRISWVESLGITRLAKRWEAGSTSAEKDWDHAVWEEVAAFMGGPVNQEAFRALASLLPYPLLARYRAQPYYIEALLLGLGGFLEKPDEEAYPILLQETWDFLRQKHQLPDKGPVPMRFLRMRPAAFPTLRLAQLATWVRRWPHPSRLLDAQGIAAFLETPLLPHPYWRTHYRIGTASQEKEKPLGRSQKIILVINVLAPLAFQYHRFHGRTHPEELLEGILSSLPPEDNHITRKFRELGMNPENALHSQGLIELKKKYCDPRRCLECQIGHRILSPTS